MTALCGFEIGVDALQLLTAAEDIADLAGCTDAEAQLIVAGSIAGGGAAEGPPGLAAGPTAEAKAAKAAKEAEGMAFITKRGDLEEADVNSVLGYPIDTFQQGCLKVIVKPDVDLLAMAPTGSGKTAVALMAILQAFRRGKKAVYTSPIKALSNQKYAEFKGWFAKRGLDGGASRCSPATSRSARRRARSASSSSAPPRSCATRSSRSPASNAGRHAAAAAGAAARRRRAGAEPRPFADVDLDGLGCVVSDEIHYINDVERGACGRRR